LELDQDREFYDISQFFRCQAGRELLDFGDRPFISAKVNLREEPKVGIPGDHTPKLSWSQSQDHFGICCDKGLDRKSKFFFGRFSSKVDLMTRSRGVGWVFEMALDFWSLGDGKFYKPEGCQPVFLEAGGDGHSFCQLKNVNGLSSLALSFPP
jgi:hypothetical protein